MRCVQFRTALSARIDGEPAGLPDRRLDKHVARCGACREWLDRAERLRGAVTGAGAGGPSADWSAKLLASLGGQGLGGQGVGADGSAAAGRPGQGSGGPVR
ncbi:zf-HC2 domain-containing protein [Kitasatospora sp. NPDC056181]|uniref:zf-HC2 domain-containing protein n=1 Tax=Kitasatospora sp. NPDC056181 TaxID=3345737 RepID=UPI0035DD8E91